MTQSQIPVIEPEIKEKLFNALIDYFSNENYKLGLEIKEQQIIYICRILLSGNEDLSDSYLPWLINEQTILDEYWKEKIEIMDYLHLISIKLRKQFGQYSTPINIVRNILKSVGYNSSKDILKKRLIDPACGSGAFLVEAARIYLNVLKKVNMPFNEWYPKVIPVIIGIDIDPNSCFFARLNLAMLLAPSILEFVARSGVERLNPLPVYCADTLELFASEDSDEKYFYDRLNISLKNKFNFVVGNPPYFKIRELNKTLKSTFSDSIYGHPNAYGLFIHAGIEMLKDKGELGFIVPRSMLSGLYFKNLRDLIERKTAIKEITCISERKKVFDNVLHGTMILSLKQSRKYDKEVNVSCVQSLNDIGTHHNKITIPEDNIIQHLNGTTVWFVSDSLKTYKIVNRIIKQHTLLSGSDVNCRAKTGQIVWNRVKPLLTETAGLDTLPLLWATDIGKFSFSFNRMGAIRPCFLKVDSKTENLIVNGPSILIQRVTADEQPSRIVACIPEEFCNRERDGYFLENHLNFIQPEKKESKIDLYYILGILNSEIVEFFFRAMNGNTQVSATELNLVPIPLGRYEYDISKIAKEIQNTVNDKEKNGLIKKLNLIVARAYGLSINELEFIKQYLNQRVKRTFNKVGL